MKTATFSLTLLFASILGACFATPAMADHDHDYGARARLDDLASRLQSESRTLYFELRRASIGRPEFYTVVNEVGQLSRQAGHIHHTIHAGGSLQHLHRDVKSLESLMHHVSDHLAPFKHYRRHAERMDRLVHQIDDCIHDLSDHHPGHGGHYGVGYKPGFGGFSFGGKGFSIQFGK